MEPEQTILALKHALADQLSIPANQQRIMFKGKSLGGKGIVFELLFDLLSFFIIKINIRSDKSERVRHRTGNQSSSGSQERQRVESE